MGQSCSASAHEIIPGLWLGDCDTADDVEKLLSWNVHGVVDLTGEAYTHDHTKLKYLTIHIVDDPQSNIEQYFQQTNEFIHSFLSKSQSVYVHCLMGVSRSSSIVIAYLMWAHHLSLRDAMSLVQRKRACIKPNIGFESQLKNYEKMLKDHKISKK